MEKKYSSFYRFFDHLWRKTRLGGKNNFTKNHSTWTLPPQDLDVITEDMNETHEIIIREFYYRNRRN
ncbi:MAG: hypothetical protein WD491_14765 [Balneolales bacterium]